jgi:hypothetical protein
MDVPGRDENAVLTASEIGTYAFCPQAWYLQRQHTRRSAATARRLARGSAAHEHIGRRTDSVRLLERVQKVVFVAGLFIAGLLVIAWLLTVGKP